MNFKDKLIKAALSNKSWLCVGLDPDTSKLPTNVDKSTTGISQFLKNVIDTTKDLVCAYKPNSAFYEQFGADGINLLKEIIDYIPAKIPVILDAKRGDIGNTSRMYAVAAFEHLGVDALTVNPYMGYDCVKPFLDYKDKGVVILCLTSNPSSNDFQKRPLTVGDNEPAMLYQLVAKTALAWNENDNVCLVIGATKPEELGELRKLVGDDIPILIPGVGAQGGDLESSLKNGSNAKGQLAIINVSRSVLYVSTDDDYAARSRANALELVSKIRGLLF
ncbi:MAG: orotidine-5'-phosphate decarboxylase [candidate division Zixibacteria bacterium]|nr:orotidine-5'-phosphate decarboxylase [candidate division Zixibacteria bacterium]